LNNTDPLPLEDTPLQLALLTMEVATIRSQLNQLTAAAIEARLDCGEF
jgi:hypothetical protein